MIQRIQSVWLLLAAICAALMFVWPLYGGTLQNGTVKYFLANSSYSLMIMVAVVAILSFITIFLFKNRPAQIKLIWLALLASIGLAVLAYYNSSRFASSNNFIQSGYKAVVALPIIVFIFLILALRGVRADEKLVRNADRFRK
jgi:predicted membrane-bound mannosyltransferase